MEGKISVVLLISLIFYGLVSAQYTTSSLVLTVYEDGYVKVNYELLPDEYVSQMEVQLLGAHIEDVMVEDENGNPLDYQLNGNELMVFTDNASVVNITYYTPDLTSKQGIVWTLNLSSPEPFTVVLPENAVVVDLSDIPLQIAGNRITMPPGNQSISYTLSERVTTSGAGGTAENTAGRSVTILLVLVGIALAGGATYLGMKKKSGGFGGRMPTREEFEERLNNLDLSEEEKRALLYLFDRGGRASQAEVREAIGLPKTTAWRMFKRLEKMGLVRILKGKKENWVELRF
ncbi:helix-turn-helix domain-containing protein [Thermococcus sp.]|uniref:helix-turn-helix transcriptional regulator n=1 Tax=Thermococcus sp. TaxID=35749 RepID=UPI00260A74EB|nr:helix-turn-helix domain-containing protein [Thermococcus sp.]